MAKRKDIDDILRDWPFVPGEISARLVKASGGREVLQLRIDMGVLQMETTNRPDGSKPGGAETYFDYLLAVAVHEGESFVLDEEQCAEVDREFVQYYQRRLCWLALREFRRAVRDADHSLALMDFVRDCSPDEEWTVSHEQYRPFILFHRTQAAALAELEVRGAESAIEAVNQGLDAMRRCFDEQELTDQFDDDELVLRLRELRESVRQRYDVGRTLAEQLSDAINSEEYERAARLRDEIARRKSSRR